MSVPFPGMNVGSCDHLPLDQQVLASPVVFKAWGYDIISKSIPLRDSLKIHNGTCQVCVRGKLFVGCVEKVNSMWFWHWRFNWWLYFLGVLIQQKHRVKHWFWRVLRVLETKGQRSFVPKMHISSMILARVLDLIMVNTSKSRPTTRNSKMGPGQKMKQKNIT